MNHGDLLVSFYGKGSVVGMVAEGSVLRFWFEIFFLVGPWVRFRGFVLSIKLLSFGLNL